MPFNLFQFLEIIIIGAFLITLTQLEQPGSTGKVFIPLEIYKLNSTFETRNFSHFLLHHLHVHIWRVLFTSLSADEFQFNSKSAYIPNCINILRLFLKKNQKKISKTYLRVFTTFIILHKKKTKPKKKN